MAVQHVAFADMLAIAALAEEHDTVAIRASTRDAVALGAGHPLPVVGDRRGEGCGGGGSVGLGHDETPGARRGRPAAWTGAEDGTRN